MNWSNALPSKVGYWLAVKKDGNQAVLLDIRLEDHLYANMFGIRSFQNKEKYLVPYFSEISGMGSVTSYDEYCKFCFVEV